MVYGYCSGASDSADGVVMDAGCVVGGVVSDASGSAGGGGKVKGPL